jgi:hypothetical protein
MLALIVCVQALDSARFLRQLHRVGPEAVSATEPPSNATVEKPVPTNWTTFVGDYCGSFCNMSGVDPAHCTLCAQRMDFTVHEGKVSCAVECQGVQTDTVTEEAISCSERLDKCMFVDVDAATCKLECATSTGEAAAKCAKECVAFKQAQRKEGHSLRTFFGDNEVETTVEKEVNGTNGTELKNVTVLKVEGVEPLPTAAPGDRETGAVADFRFHGNETAWLAKPKEYCASWYCNAEAVGVAGVDAYHCVECVNRLNNSIEAGIHKCHVGCEMEVTDATNANHTCSDDCMYTQFDIGTCYLECALPMNKKVPDCMKTCEQSKSAARAEGKEVRPFGWPEPLPANTTNSSNATEETAKK